LASINVFTGAFWNNRLHIYRFTFKEEII